ncbi:MAG: winged helix-turn-helix transcriptional regulator [Nitrospirae bacterium]|nr:winged helix-turn-helix transcriptional regulator [Nitrospirota bacterium]MBI3595496.1 winged helix-turn-helix transcriptional regulator [Nitrospirota bacterium]
MEKDFQNEVYQLHADICQALSDPKRILILYELREGRRSVGQLAANLNLKQANLSQHLMVLREREMVKMERQGTAVYYSLVNLKVIEALDLLREVLAEKLYKTSMLANSLANSA